jgi:hypothetical protein
MRADLLLKQKLRFNKPRGTRSRLQSSGFERRKLHFLSVPYDAESREWISRRPGPFPLELDPGKTHAGNIGNHDVSLVGCIFIHVG